MTDVNDNAPKIDVPKRCVDISEFHNTRDIIVTLKVKDPDDHSTPNGRTLMKIVSGNEQGWIP